jgi:hypothetical protein
MFNHHLDPTQPKQMTPENMGQHQRNAGRQHMGDAAWQVFLFTYMLGWTLSFALVWIAERFAESMYVSLWANWRAMAPADASACHAEAILLSMAIIALASLVILVLAFFGLRRCTWLTRLLWLGFIFWPLYFPLGALAAPAFFIEIVALLWRGIKGSGGSENN